MLPVSLTNQHKLKIPLIWHTHGSQSNNFRVLYRQHPKYSTFSCISAEELSVKVSSAAQRFLALGPCCGYMRSSLFFEIIIFAKFDFPGNYSSCIFQREETGVWLTWTVQSSHSRLSSILIPKWEPPVEVTLQLVINLSLTINSHGVAPAYFIKRTQSLAICVYRNQQHQPPADSQLNISPPASFQMTM